MIIHTFTANYNLYTVLGSPHYLLARVYFCSYTRNSRFHARYIDVETAFCADTTLGRRRMNVKKTLFHSGDKVKKLNLI